MSSSAASSASSATTPSARSVELAAQSPRVSSRPPKPTVRGLGDSEPPTAVRAPVYDPRSDAVLLGALRPSPAVPADLGPPPQGFVPTASAPRAESPPVAEEPAAPARRTELEAHADRADVAEPAFAPAAEPRFDDASPVVSRAAVHGSGASGEEADAGGFDPSRFADDGPPPAPLPDAAMGAALAVPDDVDQVIRTLEAQGLFERQDGAEQAWTARKDVPRQGTRLGRTMTVLWALGIAAAVGGYFGFQAWIASRHAQANVLLAEAEAHALAGEHKDLVDAERKLRFARDLHPHEARVMQTLLFVQAERALEEGAFEPGFLRATIARAEADKIAGPELSIAKAIVAQAESAHDDAAKLLADAQKVAPKDGRVLYAAGRIAQRLGDERALELLTAATNASPAPLAAKLALAELLSDDGRKEEAVAAIQAVLKQKPNHLRASLWDQLARADAVDVDAGLGAAARLEAELDVGAPTDRVLAALLKARLLRRKGDEAGATAAVDAAMRAGAAEPRLLALVAEEAKGVGLLTRAQGAAMDAVARAPMNADFRKLLASILLAQRDGVRALKQLEGLSTDDPLVLEMSAEAALLVGTDKVVAAASTMLGGYLGKHQDAGVRLRALALRLDAAQGKASAALSPVRALLKAHSDEPSVLLAAGEIQLRAGDAAAAQQVLTKLVKGAPNDADAHYWLGRATRAAGNAADALAHLEKAVALSPLHLAARRALGRLLLDLGKFEEADKLYEALARASGIAQGESSLVQGRVGRSEALLGLGRAAEARAQLASLGAEEQETPLVKEASAMVSLAEGKPGDAVAALRALAEATDASADTIALYGQALFAAGDSLNANKQFDRALSLDAGLPEALLGKALTALRAEKAKDAHKALDAAAEALKSRVRPGRVVAQLHTLRGRAFLLEGKSKLEPARSVLREAVATPGAAPDAHFFLGESLAAANSPEAYEAYAKYLALEPAGEYAKRAERAMRRK